MTLTSSIYCTIYPAQLTSFAHKFPMHTSTRIHNSLEKQDSNHREAIKHQLSWIRRWLEIFMPFHSENIVLDLCRRSMKVVGLTAPKDGYPLFYDIHQWYIHNMKFGSAWTSSIMTDNPIREPWCRFHRPATPCQHGSPLRLQSVRQFQSPWVQHQWLGSFRHR